MQRSNMPVKIPVPFASAAAAAYVHTIPQGSQIGITDGAASYSDGFPPLNFTNPGSGGKFVDGRDVNGILRAISEWIRWQCAGSPNYYDSAFASSVGGYPYGAVLASNTAGVLWVNTAENNLTDPDSGGAAGWTAITSATSVSPASDIEAVAGIITNKFISPHSLSHVLNQILPHAANLAETYAGMDNSKYVTPYDLSAMTGVIPDGQTIVLLGGWMLKYTSPTINTGGNVTYTSFAWTNAFPSGNPPIAFSATPTGTASFSWTGITAALSGMSADGGTLICDSCSATHPIINPMPVNIWAIGR